MKKLLFILTCMLTQATVFAADTTIIKNKVSVYAGIGYCFYFNEMKLLKEGIRSNNYGTTLRVMWEPRYRISLGFETGFIRVYQWENPKTKLEKISLYTVPLNTVFCMQLYKGWYSSLAFGSSILLNQVTGKNDSEFASQFTVVNIYVETGVKMKMGEHWTFIPALTYLFISKTEDRSLMLQTKFGYTF